MLYSGCLIVTWHIWSAILNSNIKITQNFELYEHNTITNWRFKHLTELPITLRSADRRHTEVSNNNQSLLYIQL